MIDTNFSPDIEDIPKIDTSIIPPDLLTHGQLGMSVAKLDAISSEQAGSRAHHDAVMQVIKDARAINIDLRLN